MRNTKTWSNAELRKNTTLQELIGYDNGKDEGDDDFEEPIENPESNTQTAMTKAEALTILRQAQERLNPSRSSSVPR